MTKMITTRILGVTMIVAAVCLGLVGCGSTGSMGPQGKPGNPGTPANQLPTVITVPVPIPGTPTPNPVGEVAQRAAQFDALLWNKDLDTLMTYVSSTYNDKSGNSKSEIRLMLKAFMGALLIQQNFPSPSESFNMLDQDVVENFSAWVFMTDYSQPGHPKTLIQIIAAVAWTYENGQWRIREIEFSTGTFSVWFTPENPQYVSPHNQGGLG